MMWALLLLLVSQAFCHNFTAEYVLQAPPPQRLHLGEAAIGGMIPTSVLIVVVAILRIIQNYQRRRLAIRQPSSTLGSQSSQ